MHPTPNATIQFGQTPDPMRSALLKLPVPAVTPTVIMRVVFHATLTSAASSDLVEAANQHVWRAVVPEVCEQVVVDSLT